jgi:hypothetical protein
MAIEKKHGENEEEEDCEDRESKKGNKVHENTMKVKCKVNCPMLRHEDTRWSGDISALDRGCQLYVPTVLPPRKQVSITRWTGGWVDPRSGLEAMEKEQLLILSGIEQRFLHYPEDKETKKASFRIVLTTVMFREAPHPSTELQLRPPVWV